MDNVTARKMRSVDNVMNVNQDTSTSLLANPVNVTDMQLLVTQLQGSVSAAGSTRMEHTAKSV